MGIWAYTFLGLQLNGFVSIVVVGPSSRSVGHFFTWSVGSFFLDGISSHFITGPICVTVCGMFLRESHNFPFSIVRIFRRSRVLGRG